MRNEKRGEFQIVGFGGQKKGGTNFVLFVPGGQ
jgi:hypothetical protein